jgi:hypothetical protein
MVSILGLASDCDHLFGVEEQQFTFQRGVAQLASARGLGP